MSRIPTVALPLLAVLLSACAQTPQKPAETAKPKPTVTATKLPEPPRQPPLPNQELSTDVLYRFLMGEIAGQRGRLDVATQAYVEMARKTRDPTGMPARRAASGSEPIA